MKSFPIGRKYNCEEEWWHMEEQEAKKGKEQYRSYVLDKLNEIVIEQSNDQGEIFTDKYLHPHCKLIKVTKK